jgi:hypothetical protein
MKKNTPSSKSENPASVDDFLKPLSHIRSIDPPYFLETRIMSRIAAERDRIPPRTLALAGAGFVLLLALSIFAAAQPQTSKTETYAAGLVPHNQLYR